MELDTTGKPKNNMSNTNNWSDEEDGHTPFVSSSITARTPVKTYTTPANVENAPKKKETTMMINEAMKAMEDSNLPPTWESIIKALENVQNTLSQDTIRSHQKASAHERVGWVIDQIRGTTSASSRQPMPIPPPLTPPPSLLPASQLITGTPIDQCNALSASSPSQATIYKTPIQKAEDTLSIALKHLNETYERVGEKIKKGANPKTMSVEMPLSAFEEIGKNVSDAMHHLSHHSKHSEDVGERLSRLEATIKESLATTTKTWAQVAAVAPTPEPDHIREIQQRNLQRKLERRNERTKLEVTLTMHEAPLDAKEQLTKHTHSEITAKLQDIVQSQVTNGPTIHGIQKLKSHDLRIHCNTAEEAEQLRKLKWGEAYTGLTVRQRKYGIVVNGVPKDSIDPKQMHDSKIVKQLECENMGSGIQVAGMKPLRRKLRDNMQHFSLVVFVTNPEAADHCIKHGIYIDQRRFPAEKYAPQFQLVQCYNCQQFEHHAMSCRSLHSVCGKCSEKHPTVQCHNDTHKCIGCEGNHPAWHSSCPKRIIATQNLVTRKREASVYFNE